MYQCYERTKYAPAFYYVSNRTTCLTEVKVERLRLFSVFSGLTEEELFVFYWHCVRVHAILCVISKLYLHDSVRLWRLCILSL